MRRQTWYAVKEVPLPLRSILGKKRFIRTLQTRSWAEAIKLRYAVLADFEAEIARAERALKFGGDGGKRALDVREQIQRSRERDPESAEHTAAQVKMWDAAVKLLRERGETEAQAFAGIALGRHTPLEIFVDDWLKETRGGFKAKEYHSLTFREWIAWSKAHNEPVTVEGVTRRVAGRYVSDMHQGGISVSVRRRRMRGLRSLWAWLVEKGHAEANIWLDHRIADRTDPNPDEEARPFTAAEIHTLLDGPANLMLADLMRIAFYSGMRIEEVCTLTGSDIDTRDRTMRIRTSKTNAGRRTVPIHPEIWAIIQRRLNGQNDPNAFLIEECGGPPRPGQPRSHNASIAFRKYRKKLSVHDQPDGARNSRVTFHSWRRTFATLAEQAGVDIHVLEGVIGHKRDKLVLNRYSGGPSLEQRRAVVEAVKLPPRSPDESPHPD